MRQQLTVYMIQKDELAAGATITISYDDIFSSSTCPSIISPAELYSIFLAKNKSFPLKFKVYEFFRDQGCCVHTAVNYGLDYSIYQTLPSLCHSALSVLVVDGVSVGRGEDALRWTHVSAMTRVMGVSLTC